MPEPRGRLPGRHGREPGVWRELREHEHKAVVRIFLFQTKSPQQISTEVPLSNVQFVDTLLIRKGAGPSENQLMPIGGKVDDGEDIETAVRREALEETHLRPIPKTMVALHTVQNYHFHHETERFKKSTKHRRAYFFAASLLPDPHDVPYVLDPTEDKIVNFERLNQAQLGELLRIGTVTTEFGEAKILDSMDADITRRMQQGTETDQREVNALHHELRQQAGLRESEKKLQVLIQMLNRRHYQIALAGQQMLAIEALQLCQRFLYDQTVYDDPRVDIDPSTLITDVQVAWQQEVANHPQWDHDDIRRALQTVNMRDTLHNAVEVYDFEHGFGVPTINLILPLLLTDRLTPSAYKVLQEHPQAKQLVKIAQVLSHYQHLIGESEPAERAKIEAKLRKRMQLAPAADVNSDAFKTWLQQEAILNEDFTTDFEELSYGIDRYFEVLQQEAHITEFSIDQVNEVKGVSFDQLARQVFATAPEMQAHSPEYGRIVQWESQRKMMLLLMVHEANAYRRDILKRGITPVDQLEKKLEAPGSRADHRVLRLSGHDYAVRIERRIKSLMSFMRKLIVRDRMSAAVGNDTYAEAVIFTDDATPIVEQVYIPSGKITNEHNVEMPELFVPQVVAEYLESVFEAAKQTGVKVSVEKFKGLPKVGESFHSSSAGGGAEVRMVKFYLRHTDMKGTQRMREVQIFLPQGEGDDWQSGEVDYERKKVDDADYALRRLFSTKALRSFIELLYPAEVYGDRMQPIYSSRVKSTTT